MSKRIWFQRMGATASALREMAPAIGLGLLLFLGALPAVALLHELTVAAMAGVLRATIGLPALRDLALTAPLDPIYTNAALEMAGQIKVAGVAVAGGVGAVLHTLMPGVFALPSLADGWVSAAITPGSSLFARSVVQLGAHVAIVVLGLVLVRLALRGGLGWRAALRSGTKGSLLVLGLLVQAGIAWQMLTQPPEPADLEALGLSFAFGVLFPALTGRQLAISDLQPMLPGPTLGLIASLFALLLAYFLARVAARFLIAAHNRLFRCYAWLPWLRDARPERRRIALSLASATATLLVLTSLISAEPEPELVAAVPDEPVVSILAPKSEVAVAAGAVSDTAPAYGPTVVRVAGEPYTFRYGVGGKRQLIRGMGYNPIYAQLDREQRAARYDRDFALMRENGVNTVYGWTRAEFDGLVLDKALQHGLGVALPYHLAPDAAYEDVALQSNLKRDVLQWVESYKAHPALRMWAIGNEVLHKLVFPSWLPLKKNSDQAITRAKAFAAFYVGLIDAVHAADPDHPVLLRDAEDSYLSWIREALLARPASRPWFIYGTNIYTRRLAEVVEGWPKQNVGVALLISEFAPGGLSLRDRPEGYRGMWATLNRRRDWVLGGVPYVWTTAGPEEVDRAFGLVDANAKPVDNSLSTIANMFATTPDVERLMPRGVRRD